MEELMKYDVAVIGCGIVGAAAAYELSRYNCKVLVLEANNDVANGTTKANSAILHAGYDPAPHTLMAETNVRGVKLAKELCEKLDVEREEIGSLVLAFGKEDERHLDMLYRQGLENGVPGVRLLAADEVRAMEPNVSEQVTAALYAPTAAIVSPWEFALALAETAVVNGCDLQLSAPVTGIDRLEEGYLLHTPKGDFEARYVVNAAGLHCDKVHEMAGGTGFTVHGVRGEYYIMDKSQGHVVNHVIFQCPNEKGKGVLVSPTVHGNLFFGPRAAEHNSAAAAAQIKGVPRNRALVDCTIGHRDRTGLVCSIKGAVCHRELFACNQHSPAAHVPEGTMIVCHIICMGIIERHIARFDLDVIESLHAFQSGEGRIGIGGVVPTVKHRKSVGTDGTVCYNQLPRFVDILAGLRPSSNADHRRRRTVDFVCGPGNRGDQFRVFQSQGSFGGAVMNNGAIGNCSAGHPLNNAVLDGKICSRFRGF